MWIGRLASACQATSAASSTANTFLFELMFDRIVQASDTRITFESMARKLATADVVPLPELLDFIRPRHRMVLTTFRAGESLQSSPVTGGVDGKGRIVVASYPQRAKAANIRRRPRASVVVLSDEFDGPYVQVDGHAEVVDLPEAVEGLVEYFRSVAGEHPDWEEYRMAMVDQGKCLIRVTPQRWGPVATGGFPPG